MRLMPKLVLCALIWHAARASDGAAWAYVPAARDGRPFAGIAIPNAPSESVVTLLGVSPLAATARLEPRRVFAIEIQWLQDIHGADFHSLEKSTSVSIPAGALWPDAKGRIVAGLPEKGGVSKSVGIRNPWEVRIAPKDAGKDTVFVCGGIIIGGGSGPVAILNGRIARQGDFLGDFRVAGVLANGALLERNGSYFVIPKGQRTTVTTSDG